MKFHHFLLVKSGALYGSIAPSIGYSKMPKGKSKLKDCDISKLKAWIEAGALSFIFS